MKLCDRIRAFLAAVIEATAYINIIQFNATPQDWEPIEVLTIGWKGISILTRGEAPILGFQGWSSFTLWLPFFSICFYNWRSPIVWRGTKQHRVCHLRAPYGDGFSRFRGRLVWDHTKARTRRKGR